MQYVCDGSVSSTKATCCEVPMATLPVGATLDKHNVDPNAQPMCAHPLSKCEGAFRCDECGRPAYYGCDKCNYDQCTQCYLAESRSRIPIEVNGFRWGNHCQKGATLQGLRYFKFSPDNPESSTVFSEDEYPCGIHRFVIRFEFGAWESCEVGVEERTEETCRHTCMNYDGTPMTFEDRKQLTHRN